MTCKDPKVNYKCKHGRKNDKYHRFNETLVYGNKGIENEGKSNSALQCNERK